MVRTCRASVTAGPDAGKSAQIEKPIYRVGSHASNDLVLTDETASQHHLEIAVVPDGFRVTDLGSSNGTRLGSLRLGTLTLVDPALLELGAPTLSLEPAA